MSLRQRGGLLLMLAIALGACRAAPAQSTPDAALNAPSTAPAAAAASEASPAALILTPTQAVATAAASPSATSTHTPASPTATATATATPTAAPTTRLLFTGDINPGRCPAQIALRYDDFTRPYHQVGEVLRAAEITVGSLDGSLSDRSAPAPCPETLNLIGPARTVEGLLYAGFDVISVATNHAKDCGQLGWNCADGAFRDSLRHLAGAGIAAVGGGEDLSAARAPALVERHGVRFAFLGVTEVGMETWAGEAKPGTAPLSDETIRAVAASIRAAREQADVVVVLAQWGVEYAERPNARQLRWAGEMIAAGATLVIGNHPHVVQPLEVFAAEDGAPQALAAYALGNFVFDQGPRPTRQGVVLEVTFAGSRLESWRLLPVHIYRLHQPAWAEAEEAEEILARMATAAEALPER